MNIRQAMLKAADHIERNPSDFDFGTIDIPGGCGTPGCALGWTAFFLGKTDKAVYDHFELGYGSIGTDSSEFYSRMDSIVPQGSSDTRWGDWSRDARLCAFAMRAYADKYHPAPKQELPTAVRSIFEMSNAELAAVLDAA